MTALSVHPPLGGRPGYVRQLDGLRDAVLALGNRAEKAIDRACDALQRGDVVLAHEVERDDQILNRQRLEIEEGALRLMATQQPTASDLRFLAAVLHIVTDLERIGDHARSVARLAIKLTATATATGEPLLAAAGPVPEVPALADLVRSRLRRALDAFVDLDAGLARRVAHEDGEVDRLQSEAYARLLARVRAHDNDPPPGDPPPGDPPPGDPAGAEAATYLLWLVHNLERSGDHVTNVCERVIYAATARMEELSEPARPARPAIPLDRGGAPGAGSGRTAPPGAG